MGCSGSKQARRDRHRSPSPLRRSISYSVPVHHPGSKRKGDSYHIVALTSSTLGSLKLDSLGAKAGPGSDTDEPAMKRLDDVKVGDLSSEVNRAKAWSDMIERKMIPRTPNMTPRNEEPETINTWELMADLDDVSPLLRPAGLERSFSFHTCGEVERETDNLQKKWKAKPKSLSPQPQPQPQPMWVQMSAGGSIAADHIDPEIISTFRRALEELSPEHPFHLRSPEPEKCATKDRNWALNINSGRATPNLTGIVRARVSDFQKRIDAKKAEKRSPKAPPGGGKKVVCYHTSLRGVRRTYEECCDVRLILKGYGVRVDERDVSMDGGFKEELREIVGEGFNRLPRVFANGRYLGGAEEVRQMHEDGELGNALEGCDAALEGKGVSSGSCDACGDVRFVPCETCSGSCKVYVEEEEEEEEVVEDEEEKEEEATETGGFRRCPDCNENGIVRCPVCCCCS